MTPPAATPGGAAEPPPFLRLRRTQIFLLLVALSLLTRWLTLAVDVLDVDEAAHAVGSWEMLRGRVLYAEFVDNKPPLVYVSYALAQLLFGRGLLAVHLFTALVTVPLTAWAASAFHRHGPTGAVAALAYVTWSGAYLAHDMLSSNTEVLMMLPAAWAVVAVATETDARRPSRVVLSGVLVGLAFLFKYQAVVWLPALIVSAARGRGRRSRAALAALLWLAAFALPLFATWAVFRGVGADGPLVYWTFWNNVVYTANPITAQEAMGRAASSLLPFVLVTAVLWWAFARGLRLLPPHQRRLLGMLVLLCLVPAVLGLRFYPHYLVQFYFPLVVGAAPVLEQLLVQRKTRAARVVLAAWALTLVGWSVANAVLYFGTRVYRERDPIYARVAGRLSSDPCYRSATLFVWGYGPLFYYRTGLPAASRFVALSQARLTGYVSGNLASITGGGESHSRVVPAHWDWLLDDLERRRATYVLDTAPAGLFRWDRYPVREFPRLARYLDASFELVDAIDGVRIFRRRGCADRS